MEAQLLNVRLAPNGYPKGGLIETFNGRFSFAPDNVMI